MARASVRNASPRRARNTFGCARTMLAITGSRRASARFARSQYSGFMQREIGEQVLGLHPHHAVLARRERQVHDAAGDIGPHDARLGELEREEREDSLHAAVLDLAAGPNIVEDAGRFGVETDVPSPARLVDAPHRLHPYLDTDEVPDPLADHLRECIERRATIGEADHGV